MVYRILSHAKHVIPLFAAATIGCADQIAAPPQTAGAALNAIGLASQDDVPNRDASIGSLKSWANESDSALWQAGAKVNNRFTIGLKSPGKRRGIYRGVRLILDADLRAGYETLRHTPGVTVIAIDDALPLVKVEFADISALIRIRRVPMIDYLEPSAVTIADAGYSSGSGSGCPYPNAVSPSGMYDAYGDFIPQAFVYSGVTRAWEYAPEAGAGVKIGLVDTGVDTNVSELGAMFTSGMSTGRSFQQSSTIGGTTVTCSHGTRMASVIASPRNGIGAVGVAYRSNLYSSWSQVDVAYTNGVDQQQAIRDAVVAGSKVVSMAWASIYQYNSINDEIDRDYYTPSLDVVFVGAAGSSAADIPDKGIVLFPARKSEVLAASGADFDGRRDNQSHYGPELDLVAYQAIGTVGRPGVTLDEIANSSAATAFVTGVAALVRAKYPWMNNNAVMNRLTSTAGPSCDHFTEFGPIVNAEAAVGGMCKFHINGPTLLEFYDDSPNCQTLTYNVVQSGGAGPFSYLWNWGNGGNSTSSSMQQTFCRPPTREDDSAQLQVTMVDEGVSGIPRMGWLNLRIVNWSAYPCEDRPDVNECGGGGG